MGDQQPSKNKEKENTEQKQKKKAQDTVRETSSISVDKKYEKFEAINLCPYVINIYNEKGDKAIQSIPIHVDKQTGKPSPSGLCLKNQTPYPYCYASNKTNFPIIQYPEYGRVSGLPKSFDKPIILPHLHAIIASRKFYGGEIYILDTSDCSVVLDDITGEMKGVRCLILYKTQNKKSVPSSSDCKILQREKKNNKQFFLKINLFFFVS